MKIVKVSTTNEINDAFPEVKHYVVGDDDFRRLKKLLKSGSKEEALSILDGKKIFTGDLEIENCLQ